LSISILYSLEEIPGRENGSGVNVLLILKNPGSKKHEFQRAGTEVPASRNRSSSGPEQEFQRAGTGVPASRNRSSSEIAGISPYEAKAIHYSLFTNRQHFVDMVKCQNAT